MGLEPILINDLADPHSVWQLPGGPLYRITS